MPNTKPERCTQEGCKRFAVASCRTEYVVTLKERDGSSELRWGSGDGNYCLLHAIENGWIEREDVLPDEPDKDE